MDSDVIVIGAGLSGLVAAHELAEADRSVIILDTEPLGSVGAQAYWSLGGLFMVNSPEQRRLRIHDSEELALADWLGSAAFDRPEDYWPRRWAEAYVHFAAGEQRRWLRGRAMVPARPVGRTGWLCDSRPRELGSPFPHHVGHRTCDG